MSSTKRSKSETTSKEHDSQRQEHAASRFRTLVGWRICGSRRDFRCNVTSRCCWSRPGQTHVCPYRRTPAERSFDSGNKPVEIFVPALLAQFNRIALRQRLQIGRELFLGRHVGIADEDRKNAHVILERGQNLLPHRVARTIEPPLPGRVGHAQPAPANDDDTGVGFPEHFGNRFMPQDARFEKTDVSEHSARIERVKTIVQPAGVSSAVIAAIVDEYRSVGHAFVVSALDNR